MTIDKGKAFAIGERVIKVKGIYNPPGMVVGVFELPNRHWRYNVMHPWGIIHIYSADDLEKDRNPKSEYLVHFGHGT